MGTSTRRPCPWSSAIRWASPPPASGRAVTAVSAMVPSLAVRRRAAPACLMRYVRSPSLINLDPCPGQAPARFLWVRRANPALRSGLSHETAPQIMTYRTPNQPFRVISAFIRGDGRGEVGSGWAWLTVSPDFVERLSGGFRVGVAAQLRTGPQPAGGQVQVGRVEAVHRAGQGFVRFDGDD